jgi:hypothetical protein
MGFAEVKTAADSPSLLRKVLEAVAFMAPMSVPLPETLTDANGALAPLPEGYWPVGLVTREGYTREISVEKEDTESFGYGNPTRTDLTKAPSTLGVTPQEYGRRNLMQLIYAMDLSTIEQLASGEIVFDEPPLPVLEEYRFIRIGRDGGAANQWLIADGFPRVKLAELPNDNWATGNPFQHELKFDVFVDDELGTGCRHYIGGTAPKSTAVRTALGFTQPGA